MTDYSALGGGLLRLGDLESLGFPAHQVRRDVRRGTLIRIRPGVFVAAPTWSAWDHRQRHLARLRAALAASPRPIAAAGPSAAALWDLPRIGEWPDRATVLDRWSGGGRSETAVIRTARGAETARIVVVDGMRTTDLARTVLDTIRVSDFPTSVATADAVLSSSRSRPVMLHELRGDLLRDDTAPRRAHVLTVLSEATDCSGSVGESYARAAITALGFARPVLQHEFRDERGSMFADFYWPEAGVVAEFDGRVKYVDERFSHGDPGAVLWREKQREDRLRLHCRRIVRLIWSEVTRSERLEAILEDARVPRVRDRAEGIARRMRTGLFATEV